ALVREKELFTSVSSFVTGSIDPGLLVVSGRLNDGVLLSSAEEEVDKILRGIQQNGIKDDLEKVKTQAESMLEFGEVEVINRAMNLAFARLSGDANLVNEEAKRIAAVSVDDVKRLAGDIFREENSSVLYYRASRN